MVCFLFKKIISNRNSTYFLLTWLVWAQSRVHVNKWHTCMSTSTKVCITRVKTAKGKREIDVSSASNHHGPPLTHVFNY